MPRIWRVFAVSSLALLAIVGLSPIPASAHSKLVSTSPIDGAVLDVPPSSVEFIFDETLLEGTETISINDEQGNVIVTAPATVDGDTISLPWPAQASEGVFQAAYRVVSGDGHPVTGAITITISGAVISSSAPASTTAAPTLASTATAEPTTTPSEPAREVAGSLVVLVALGVLVLVVVAGVTLWRRRRS
jgi:methionine-rich copper-binding protein CopC